MGIKELLGLFTKASESQDWGEYPRLNFYNDGSGYIEDEYEDRVFEFDSPDELKILLEEKIRGQ